MSTPATTRQRAEESKKKWKDIKELLEVSQKDLEKWVMDKIHKATTEAAPSKHKFPLRYI